MSGELTAPTAELAQKNIQRTYKHLLEFALKADQRQHIHKVPVQILLFYTQQLGAMISAGIPITAALEFLTRGDHRGMNEVMKRVSSSVLNGKRLSVAFSEFPRVFPKVYVSLVTAAEASGKLHIVLTKLSQMLERQTSIKKRMIVTFTYPVTLVFLSGAISCFIVFYIFPVLRPMFGQVGMDLPAPTRLLISVADSIHHPGAWVLLIAGVTAAALFLSRLWQSGSDFPGGLRYRVDQFLLGLPLIGKLLSQSLGARSLYALSLMLNSGMNVIDAFVALENVVDNAYVRHNLRQARFYVREGNTVEESLRRYEVFSRGALQMLRAGEESGRLDDMMLLVADGYEMDLDLTLNRLSSTLEPLIMAVMGCIIGFICVAAILPIVNFVNQI